MPTPDTNVTYHKYSYVILVTIDINTDIQGFNADVTSI